MEPIEYRRMFEVEDRHWWFQSRLLMIEALFARHILSGFGGRAPDLLDLGCGTGLFLSRRAADCHGVGADFSRQALVFCASRGLRRVAQADAARLPFSDASFDVVTAFDLIEHVADDRALIAEAWRVLRPGGFLLATVPAHPVMWSGHDVSLHHYRRYRRGQFEALFAGSGWQPVRTTYGFTLIFPAALIIRVARRVFGKNRPQSDTSPVSGWINKILITIHRAETGLLSRINLPAGVSLFTIQMKINR
jgi:SAM-dependent methyltransferase